MRGDLHTAETWHRKALEIDERNGDENGMANAYHCLGSVAKERYGSTNWQLSWLWKSLHIKEKHGNKRGASESYHQLGVLSQKQKDLDAAEKWYRKSLEIDAKQW